MNKEELLNYFSDFQRIKVFSKSDENEDVSSTIWYVQFNRPSKRNAIDKPFWEEMKNIFEKLSLSADCRCIILTNEGTFFSAGIDLKFALSYFDLGDEKDAEAARKSAYLRGYIKFLQDCVSSIEDCTKPVIACVDGGCLGAGVDIITACDIRLCSKSSFFSVKEVDIGLASDLGTLQRLPKIVKNGSWVREICYTARNFASDEAQQHGLISSVYKDKASLLEEGHKLALSIVSKSPLAIYGTKCALNYSREHTTQEGLDFQALWNSSMLQTQDLIDAASKSKFKNLNFFSKL